MAIMEKSFFESLVEILTKLKVEIQFNSIEPDSEKEQSKIEEEQDRQESTTPGDY